MASVPSELPPQLRGPVEVALARTSEVIPGERALAGGSRYEPKWDGFRQVVVHDGRRVRLWSRQGTDLSDRFPDVASAAAIQMAPGTVLDGEVVVWAGDRLSFDLLQRRLVTSPGRIGALVRANHASYVAFDVLATNHADLRSQPWTARRQVLEHLAHGWTSPLEVSPYTADLEEARGWFVDYAPAGIEGLVCKGAATTYSPGKRRWLKVKARTTLEVVVGAVIGPMDRPQVAVLGLPDAAASGGLRVVGRTSPLTAAQAASLGAVLAAPAGPHPWPDRLSPGHFGGEKVTLTHVDPVVVAEVSADTALQAGRLRHSARWIRYRADLTIADLDDVR